jgi:hypothetical protein
MSPLPPEDPLNRDQPGTLVFVPSNVKLLKYGKNKSFPTNYKLTEEPFHALMVKRVDESNHVEIHHEGDTWFVKESDITYGE